MYYETFFRTFSVFLVVNNPYMIYATIFCKSFDRDGVRTSDELLLVHSATAASATAFFAKHGCIDHLSVINPLKTQYKS